MVEAICNMFQNKKMQEFFNEKEFQDFLILLGQNIRKSRKRAKLSQEKLAFNFESARNYIGCIERAEKTPSIKTLFKIAKMLDVSVEDLFKNTM